MAGEDHYRVGHQLGRSMSTAHGTGEKPSRMLFGGLAIFALLKDMLDLIGLGSLPVVGTVVTLGFSATIFMLLLLFDRSGGRANRKIAQGMAVTACTLIEGLLFGLNFLPIQTLTVLFLYSISYRSWRKEHKARVVSEKKQARAERVTRALMLRQMAERQAAIEARAIAEAEAVAAESGGTTVQAAPVAAFRGAAASGQGSSALRGTVAVNSPAYSQGRPAANDPRMRAQTMRGGAPQMAAPRRVA